MSKNKNYTKPILKKSEKKNKILERNAKGQIVRSTGGGGYLLAGSEKNITPDELLQHFEDYKIYCKDNPKIKEVPNTKTDSVIQLRMEVPLTKKGFILYLRHKGISGNGGEMLFNRDNRYPEFAEVNKYIDDSTTDDQFSGAMAGIFNHNLTARALGLTDRQEIKTEGKIEIDFNDAD